jgi:class 3 adenylate cyclase
MAGTTGPRGRFGRRLAAAVLVLAIVPAAIVGWSLIAVNEDALEDTSRELLFSVIDDVGHTLDAAFAAPSLGLTAIANALTDDHAPAAERTALVRQLVAALPGLTAVGFYDQAGSRFDAARRIGDTTALPDTLPDELRRTAEAGGRALGAVVAGPAGARVPIVQRIDLRDARWYAYAPVSLAALDARVAEIARDRFGGRASSVFVVDRQLRVVSHPDPEQAQAMAPAADVAILRGLSTTPAGQQFLVYASYPSPAGTMVGAVRSLPSTPFAVVAQLPRSQAFASIPRMRWTVLGVLAIALAIAAAVALALARRMSAPIGRLVGFSHRLAARDFAATADVHTGDELEALAIAMTGAARALGASEAQLVEEAAIRADLGRYLPRQLVDRIVRREQSLELGGHRRTVTVLFADVASFTTLTESYPPDVVVTILNQLFTILSEIVFRHDGTVDKYIGDCIMAFWNAPDDQPDHAARALAAASDMLRWLEIGNEAWQANHGITIRLAIGVNTGEVVVGNFGSAHRMTYTCIGDAVNVAARLEGIARPQQILVSRATHDAAPTAVEYRAVGAQKLSGRIDPIEVFEVSV